MMTGSSGHFDARGLVPRTLSYLFSSAEAEPEAPMASRSTISVSFFEIYEEDVRDLLTSDRRVVSLKETEKGVDMDLIEKQVGEMHGRKHDLFVHDRTFYPMLMTLMARKTF